MYLNKKVFLLVILFFICILPAVRAEVDTLLPDEKNIETDTSNYSDTDIERVPNNSNAYIVKRQQKHLDEKLELQDSYFNHNGNITLSHLIGKVSLIVIVLLVLLFLTKLFLSRFSYQFDKPGSLLDNLTMKLNETFSASKVNGLKLKQTLILTPGQNLYVVEVDDHRLLLGGTHQGGVQFLADLSQSKAQEILDIKRIEGINGHLQDTELQSHSVDNPFVLGAEHPVNEISHESTNHIQPNFTAIKHPLKRRTNFRQTLLSNAK